MAVECPHGIVAGQCNFCLAEQLEYESKVIEAIRSDARESERKKGRKA